MQTMPFSGTESYPWTSWGDWQYVHYMERNVEPLFSAEEVGIEVKVWLTRRGLSQRALADALGITPSALSRRLRGAMDFSVNELGQVAALLDITLADLLGPSILQARRSPHTELVGAGASEASAQLPRLDSNQQPFD